LLYICIVESDKTLLIYTQKNNDLKGV